MAKKQDQESQESQESQDSKAGLVRMVRDAPQHPGGPVTADVHPDEVPSYSAADWRAEKA